MKLGYARTSTEEQKAGMEAQVRDLLADGCLPHIYKEHISSVADHRPELEAIIDSLAPGMTLVVTKLDRLARSTIGLWRIIERLEVRGAGLRILNFGGETVDTKSATGKLILTIFAGFAQFEREMMLERQAVGIVKAKEEGKYTGRKSNTDAPAVVRLKRQGMSIREIAAHLEIGRGAVLRALGRQEAA